MANSGGKRRRGLADTLKANLANSDTLRTKAQSRTRETEMMDEDTTDMEQDTQTRRRGKPDRKRRISTDSEEILPQKRNEGDRPGRSKALRKRRSHMERTDNEEELETESTTTGPLYAIKARAEAIQKKLTSYIFNTGNGIEPETGKHILTKINKLHSLLQESLILNSNLEGQITALKTENAEQRKGIEMANRTAAATHPEEKRTYAERLGIKSKNAELSSMKQDPPNVVLIRPKDTKKFETSEETKKALTKLVSPKEENLQIRNVRRAQGNGLIVETAKSSNVEALLKNEKLRSAGLIVDVPMKKSPRLIIYGAPRRDDDAEILQAIIDQNLSPEETQKYGKQIKIAFKTGSKNNRESCNIVLEASREARELLIRREKLYIMWQCCHVRDYIAATRCYKCQAYGHTTKYCKAEKDICGHCSNAGHMFKNCPNKEKHASCVNCKKAGKQHNHSVTDKDCPFHIVAINTVLSRTDYGQ